MKYQKGQILLIAIMLLATVTTVVLSLTFKSVTDTQLTKLEEENQKALAAAEAGIEALLNQSTASASIAIGSLSNLENFQGEATVIETSDKATFVTPQMNKDEGFEFYVSGYNLSANTFSTPYAGSIEVYYGSQNTCGDIALELTLFYDSDYKIKRFIADAGDKFGSNTDDEYNAGSTPTKIEDQSFNCRTNAIDISAYTQAKMLLVKPLFKSTKIGLKGLSGNIPPQGKIIISEAKSPTGVTKRVQLFQSYPQIPLEFFNTSF